MLSSVRAFARRALVGACAGVLVRGAVPPAASDSLDELLELKLRAWAGGTELLDQVYAPDGVHTATFYDRTRIYEGPEGIAEVAGGGGINLIGPRIVIPAAEGEWRWASFVDLAGGTVCLWRASGGLIVRHDCVLPEMSYASQPAAILADDDTSRAIDELTERLAEAWQTGTPEALAAAYAPDAVHSARSINATRRYEGPDEIAVVAGSAIGQIGPRVDFEAPEGELAWAQVVEVAGGSVCLFRARDGMITRHDCFLPIAM
jgi:hypothetical protein